MVKGTTKQSESKDEAQYAPSAAQVDAEERRANDNVSSKMLTTAEAYEPDESDTGRDYGDVDRSGYIGTNPEYQTYVTETETEKPGVGDGVDDEIAQDFLDAKGPEVTTPDSLEGDDTAGEGEGEKSAPPTSSPSSSSGSSSSGSSS